MMDPRVIRKHDVAMRTVAKQSDDARVRAVEHAHDTPLDSLPLGGKPTPANLHQHVISVHRVFRRVARNENIAFNIRDRFIRNHESVSVLMENKAAAHASLARFASRDLLPFLCWRGLFPWLQTVFPCRNFYD